MAPTISVAITSVKSVVSIQTEVQKKENACTNRMARRPASEHSVRPAPPQEGR